jgi:hypothetical protein
MKIALGSIVGQPETGEERLARTKWNKTCCVSRCLTRPSVLFNCAAQIGKVEEGQACSLCWHRHHRKNGVWEKWEEIGRRTLSSRQAKPLKLRTAREEAEHCWVCQDILHVSNGTYTWSYFHCKYNPHGYAEMARHLHDEMVKRGPP